MTRPSLAILFATVSLSAPVAAIAQWVPGSEIVGQTLQVETNGITNTVHFASGGAAHITSPGGQVVNASWTSGGNELCLHTASGKECWPYQTAFQAGQAITLMSSCNSTSRWLAAATNQPPPPPTPPPQGERG
jgi:hypothetical protein